MNILAVVNVKGFVKHISVSEKLLNRGTIDVVVPRVLTNEVGDDIVIRFYLEQYDKENHIAYFNFGKRIPEEQARKVRSTQDEIRDDLWWEISEGRDL